MAMINVQLRHRLKQRVMPVPNAFPPRRKITPLASRPGKQNPIGTMARIPDRRIHTQSYRAKRAADHPRVGEGPPGRMNPRARRLSSNADAGRGRQLRDGMRLMRQWRLVRRFDTDAACIDATGQACQRGVAMKRSCNRHESPIAHSIQRRMMPQTAPERSLTRGLSRRKPDGRWNVPRHIPRRARSASASSGKLSKGQRPTFSHHGAVDRSVPHIAFSQNAVELVDPLGAAQHILPGHHTPQKARCLAAAGPVCAHPPSHI
jgi:hypothetical protein